MQGQMGRYVCFPMPKLSPSLRSPDSLMDRYAATIKQSQIPPSTGSRACLGLSFLWTLGSPYLTYPFSFHDPSSNQNLEYEIIDIDAGTSTITVRSLNCSRTTSTDQCCPSCYQTTRHLNSVLERANRPPQNISNHYLSHAQLCRRFREADEQRDRDRIQVSLMN
jgi:hypothetical protein